MSEAVVEKPRFGTAWYWAERREYTAVRADKVKRGDIYANGATVTVSRRALPKDVVYGLPSLNGVDIPVEECWHIACGKGMSLTCGADRPVIVGRAKK